MSDLLQYLSATTTSPQQEGLLTLEEVQKRHVLYALGRVGNNKARPADILNISRATLYNFWAKAESEAKAVKATV